MVEVSEGEIQTTTMDYSGLVPLFVRDLQIAERIDSRLPSDSRRKVCSGPLGLDQGVHYTEYTAVRF